MMWLTELYLRMFTPREDEDEGATMVEYGLMVSLIAIACIAVITVLSGKLQGVFTTISNAL